MKGNNTEGIFNPKDGFSREIFLCSRSEMEGFWGGGGGRKIGASPQIRIIPFLYTNYYLPLNPESDTSFSLPVPVVV